MIGPIGSLEDDLRDRMEHFKAYRNHPLLQQVLTEQTTFAKEVQGFYDIRIITFIRQ